MVAVIRILHPKKKSVHTVGSGGWTFPPPPPNKKAGKKKKENINFFLIGSFNNLQ